MGRDVGHAILIDMEAATSRPSGPLNIKIFAPVSYAGDTLIYLINTSDKDLTGQGNHSILGVNQSVGRDVCMRLFGTMPRFGGQARI